LRTTYHELWTYEPACRPESSPGISCRNRLMARRAEVVTGFRPAETFWPASRSDWAGALSTGASGGLDFKEERGSGKGLARGHHWRAWAMVSPAVRRVRARAREPASPSVWSSGGEARCSAVRFS